MYWFTGDEHYGHFNVIKYTGRPFIDINEMNYALIDSHNDVVKDSDIVIHVGDFTLNKKEFANSIIKQLNGNHVFLKGSHDRWLKNAHEIWEKKVNDIYVTACHYAMRTWPRSHYGSWQLHGHSHGTIEPIGLQWDVGVDNNDYYPVSMDQLVSIMKDPNGEWFRNLKG